MKKTFTFLLACLLVFCTLEILAENGESKRPVVPLQPPNPTLYATDIYLNEVPTQDQRNATVCVAFNGWIYAAYTYWDPGTSTSYWQIMRSIDDGATWTFLQGSSLSGGTYYAMDIEVSGNTIADLVVYLARVYSDASYGYLRVSEYTGTDGTFIRNLVADYGDITAVRYNDVSIATDYKWPAVNTSPFSVAIAYSKWTPSSDFIGYKVSGDGGVNITDEFDVVSTGMYSRGVSIAYGRCWNNFNGRYFVAYELLGSGASTGNIYVAHTGTYFNSTFTTPYQLDNEIGTAEGYCFNPVVACQYNDVDNDVSHLTAVVMVTRDYAGMGTDYDVITMYNKDPTNTDTWVRCDVANTSYNDWEGDINFDPVGNNFLVTWVDVANQLLPYVVQGQNMPGSWYLINSGYNNDANLSYAYPKVEINPAYTQVAHVWIGDRPGGNGAAMFDAEWSTVGIPPVGTTSNTLDLKAYPNPTQTTAYLSFTLKEAQHVSVSLINMYGQTVRSIADMEMTAGDHTLTLNVGDLPAGCYHYNFLAGSSRTSGQIVVTH